MIRSYPTVIVWAHQQYVAMAVCPSSLGSHASMMSHHSSHDRCVAAWKASLSTSGVAI